MKNISLYLRLKIRSCGLYIDDTVPFLLPHLFERIRNVESTNFFVVLEFQKLVSTMSRHVHEDVGSIICQEPFGTRYRRLNASYPTSKRHLTSLTIKYYPRSRLTCQNSDKILHRYFIPAIVDLDVITVKVKVAPRVGIDRSWELVSRVTCNVVR